MNRIPWYLVAGLLIAGFLLRGDSSDVEATTSHNQALLKLGTKIQATADSLHRLETLNAAQARAFRFVQGQAMAQVESLRASLAGMTPADSLRTLPVLVGHLLAAGASCDSAFAAESLSLGSCAERAALLQQRIDTLTSALGRQIEVSQCRLLFIHCPTRRQAFIVGSLLGLFGGYVLK